MPSNSDYPPELENAWLQHAMHVTRLANPRLAVERLESAAGSLSEAFTTGRDPAFSGYSGNRRALAAYGLFFFPRAYTRTRIALRECRKRRGIPTGDSIRILDLGAGTGAAGLASLHELSDGSPDARIELEMVDQASEGTNLARDIFSAGRRYWPRATMMVSVGDARTFEPKHKADLIVCSFALNEWMEQQPDDTLLPWVLRLTKSLKPGGWLLLLEPALRFSVERMERLRDRIAEEGQIGILGPCPHHQPCPMLAEKRGWCHEVRTWRPPESTRWINRRLQRDIHLLKFSMLVLENAPPAADASPWMRLVSPVRHEKGKYVFHGCGHDGRIHACEWLTRNLTREQKETSNALERGDQVHWTANRILGDGNTERSEGPPDPA